MVVCSGRSENTKCSVCSDIKYFILIVHHVNVGHPTQTGRPKLQRCEVHVVGAHCGCVTVTHVVEHIMSTNVVHNM